MNRRGKRLTLGVMAVGLAVLLVLGIVHRDAVRDHMEAWHFQLTRDTETVDLPTGTPLVFDSLEAPSWPPTFGEIDAAELAVILGACGYRVLEQRFPRRAYVVILDEEQWSRQEPDSLGGGGR